MSKQTRHAAVVVAINDELRRRFQDGTRVEFDYRQIAEWMNVTSGTASSAIITLAKMEGSGLKRVTAGKYQYVKPVNNPEAVEHLRGSTRTLKPAPSGFRRSGLPSALDSYIDDLEPGTIFDINDAARALQLWAPGSVGKHLLDMANLEDNPKIEIFSQGAYRRLSTPVKVGTSASPERSEKSIITGEPLPVQSGGRGYTRGPSPRMMEDAAERRAKEILSTEREGHLKLLDATSSDGYPIAQSLGSDRKLYKLVEI